ncbi:MAG: hypothetical protein JWP86_1640, partial [Phenylobacterium sp.]|nr:hypothetical protein [Phenylobacterium sp.]
AGDRPFDAGQDGRAFELSVIHFLEAARDEAAP